MPFVFQDADIDGLKIIERKSFQDSRGYFTEFYKESEFFQANIREKFHQENLSLSRRGVIRGMHYQLKPFGQGKLVSVIRGKIMDVAVDIRRGSTSFGRYFSIELSEENMKSLWIPEGFAHGFVAIDDSYVLYRTTSEFSPTHERGIAWNDPDIGIKWPECDPVLSEKDRNYPTLREAMERGDLF
ncbi:dTDP-4-dehydrorhamnose 3,5-epimerase [Cuniculiplasma sp. SKW3]|uniref:dTDP-4-dehydrorhamnose 3,5-epimerase n=1 Tax=unclassified Cuniculiplasma TaxID=2619706 RepID=UPI003FD4F193